MNATKDGNDRALTLIWTIHALDRARQRCIPLRVAELAFVEGRPLPGCGDRFLLTRERVRDLRGKVYEGRLLALAEKAAPVVVVVEDAYVVVTVFRPAGGIDRAWRRGRDRRAS